MFITFFDIEGMIYQHTVEKGQNVNAAYYCNVLWALRDHVWRKRPGKEVIFHHDNATPHTSLHVQAVQNGEIIAVHPTRVGEQTFYRKAAITLRRKL